MPRKPERMVSVRAELLLALLGKRGHLPTCGAGQWRTAKAGEIVVSGCSERCAEIRAALEEPTVR